MASYYDYCATQLFTYSDSAAHEIKRLTLGMGSRYLIITGCGPITERVIKTMSASFDSPLVAFRKENGSAYGQRIPFMCSYGKVDPESLKIEYQFLDYEGLEVTVENAKKLAEEIQAYRADVVVAAGGGKVLDLVRAAATVVDAFRRPKVVLFPTVVASNASCTSMSIFYNAEGKMADLWNMAYPAEAVIVDTSIVISAPVRTLVAAIGDQVSSCLEAIHSLEYFKMTDTMDRLALATAQSTLDILVKYAVEAVAAMKRGEITKEFEWVVSACAYLPGPFSAIGSINLAHTLDEILLGFEPITKLLHGLTVGYCQLVELVYWGKIDELYPYVDIFKAIGIPCTFAELGIPDVIYEDIYELAEKALAEVAGLGAIKFSAQSMANAMIKTESLITEYFAKRS